MATETELKIEVGDLQLLDCILTGAEIRDAMQAAFSYVKMQSVYYDTEDEFLAGNSVILRIRTENGRSVATVKTKGEGHSRGEWECQSETPEDAAEALIAAGAPKELRDAVKKGLTAICGADFTRIYAPLKLNDGTGCDLCGDIGVVFAEGKKEPLCELELELREGSEDAMLAFGRALTEKYHLQEGLRSKYARARALRK